MIVRAPSTPPLGATHVYRPHRIRPSCRPVCARRQSMDMSVNRARAPLRCTSRSTRTVSTRRKTCPPRALLNRVARSKFFRRTIRLTGNADSSVVLNAIISADGSIRVKSSEMKRGMQTLVQNQLAGQGSVKLSLAAPDLVCKAHTRELNCNYGAAIAVHVSAR
jgi:hypothetical protein